MHDAPSVSFPVGRCVWCHRLVLALWCAGFMCALAVGWWARQPWALLGLVLVFGLGGAVYFALQSWPSGRLLWRSGVPAPVRGWWWQTDEQGPTESVTELLVLADLQSGMLLALRLSTKRRLTLWVRRAHAPLHWQALRQAIWFHAGEGAA